MKNLAILETNQKKVLDEYYTNHAQLSIGNFGIAKVDSFSDVYSFRSLLTLNLTTFLNFRKPLQNLHFNLDIDCNQESGIYIFLCIGIVSFSVNFFGVIAATLNDKGDNK